MTIVTIGIDNAHSTFKKPLVISITNRRYMGSIVTVTFNPTLDKSTSIDILVPEKKLRCTSPVLEPGGGGVNVARAISKLGGKATAVFLGGGYSGRLIYHLLCEEDVPSIMVPIEGESRENITVYESASKRQYRFCMPGPDVTDAEFGNCLELIEDMGSIDYIVASGSLTPGMPLNAFSRLGVIARKIKATYIADTSGDALAQAVASGVYLIKPNLSELAALAGQTMVAVEEVPDVARQVIRNGCCEVILVSMGAAGAMLITAKEILPIVPPAVSIKSTVGAGDSMVAGIVWSLSSGKSLPEAARYGVACGTAATLNPGTGLCKKEDVERILYALAKPV